MSRAAWPIRSTGDFDLVVVHLILALRRLKGEGAAGQDLGQRLLDTAFANFDEALREMGVGDLTVPKRVRKMAEAFYGRVEAYELAFKSGGEAALDDALQRNLYRGKEVSSNSLGWTRSKLVDFARRLDAVSRSDLLTGSIAVQGALS